MILNIISFIIVIIVYGLGYTAGSYNMYKKIKKRFEDGNN